jgi:hypothetical protein
MGGCENRTSAREAEESPLLEAVAWKRPNPVYSHTLNCDNINYDWIGRTAAHRER